jgi:hypothetical protein
MSASTRRIRRSIRVRSMLVNGRPSMRVGVAPRRPPSSTSTVE